MKIQKDFFMLYDKPAERWNDAVPLGNGRLGAMVYGNTGTERIQLNEDSLWYGEFIDRNNQAALQKLPEIRQKVLEGKVKEAEDLIAGYMVGAPVSMRHYEPLGELDIALNRHTPFINGWITDNDGAEDYRAQLDLMTGIHTITHKQDGVRYEREMFISYPAQVLCVRIKAGRPGAVNLNVQMDRCRIIDEKVPDGRRPGKFQRGGGWAGMMLDVNHTLNEKTLVIEGNASTVGFSSAVRIVSDGELHDPYSQLATTNATEVCLFLAGATTNRVSDPKQEVLRRIGEAEAKGYAALKAEHLKDFEPRMRRCMLDLGGNSREPLDKRLENAKAGHRDNNLAALYFTFGRYLMLSGGRENSTALNLQGIWNQDFVPSWDSKYTININTQMNYWPAEVANLPEVHESMFDLIARMRDRGRDTARIMYGARGTMCHHNTDYYGDCAPQDCYLAATSWPTGGAWMALHLWEHYRFTLDRDFLEKWYPTLREFALFFLDFLMDDGKGFLVTCPSVSPENRYILPDGEDTPICAGPAMDNQILRALFGACVQSAEILGLTDALTAEFDAARKRLPENGIGGNGQLLEWREEVPELTPGMGHISHLWGAYPGDEINWKDTPELANAVKKSLQIRTEHGAAGGGWPLAWFICQHARLLDRETTGEEIHRMVSWADTRNFFNAFGVFQIDGNLGATAGIAEALLQSHTGLIHLLPALPPGWKDGTVTGLCARGGTVVDLAWKAEALEYAELHTKNSGICEIAGPVRAVTLEGAAVPVEKTAHGFAFAAAAGKTYRVDG